VLLGGGDGNGKELLSCGLRLVELSAEEWSAASCCGGAKPAASACVHGSAAVSCGGEGSTCEVQLLVACREEVRRSKGVRLLRAAVIAASRGQGEGLVSSWLSARAADAVLLEFEVSVVAAGCVCAARRKIQRGREGEVVRRCN
jgi:hypothetical protein